MWSVHSSLGLMLEAQVLDFHVIDSKAHLIRTGEALVPWRLALSSLLFQQMPLTPLYTHNYK